MINVDIRTKIISEDQNVVIARPGSDYRLYPEFVEESIVGPELPSIFLEGEKVDISVEDLIPRIKRSQERRRHHRRGNFSAAETHEILVEHDDYSSNLSVRQLERVLFYYFKQAKKGDIVVIPPKSFAGDAFIGEFIDNPNEGILWNSKLFFGDPLPARRIKWIGKINKRDLSGKTIDTLRKPNAFFLLEKSLRAPIYRNSYRNYYLQDSGFTSKYDITKNEFNTRHGSIIPAFFNFVAANVKQIDNKQVALDFSSGAFVKLGKYAPDLTADIQSPGILTLTSNYITPLVASALLALALTVGADAADPNILPTIRIGNSSAPANDPCVLDVQEQVYAQLKLLGYNKWAEACENIRSAAQETGLKSESVVQK